jgi:hypothetical protein
VRRPPDTRVSTALMVYVLVLLSLQLFLLAVAVEALLGDEPPLAWSAAALSAVLALGSLLFYRYLRRV